MMSSRDLVGKTIEYDNHSRWDRIAGNAVVKKIERRLGRDFLLVKWLNIWGSKRVLEIEYIDAVDPNYRIVRIGFEAE